MSNKYSKYVTVGRDNEGKRIRKHVYGSSPAALERNIRALCREYEDLEPSEITFKTYADEWMAAFKSTKEAATVEMYEHALAKMKDIYHIKVKNVRQIDLQLIINNYTDRPRTCQILKETLNQIFEHAVTDKIIKTNTADGLEIPEYHPKEGRALTDEEVEAIRDAQLDPMDRMYISLLFYLGVRPGEALGLQRSDFNFKTGFVTIRRAIGFQANNPYVKPTKTQGIRSVPIPTEFSKQLQEYIKGCPSLFLIHRDGKPLTRTVKSDMWLRIRKAINYQLGGTDKLDMTDGLRPYTFRHNYATKCYYSGISIKKCSQLLGHRSINMIMKVYAHLDNNREPLDALKSLSMTEPKLNQAVSNEP